MQSVSPTPVGIDPKLGTPADCHKVSPTPVGIDLLPGLAVLKLDAATVSPTPVGIDPTPETTCVPASYCFPHTCGDRPFVNPENLESVEVSPTPVGIDLLKELTPGLLGSFPHTCGDRPTFSAGWQRLQSFPHTCGDRPVQHIRKPMCLSKVSPTPVGIDLSKSSGVSGIPPRFPHTCGDRPTNVAA